MAECSCKDWKPNVEKINSYINTAWARTGQEYTGKPFVYCPWCGKKLNEKENVNPIR